MAEITPEMSALIAEATSNKEALDSIESRAELLRAERVEIMKRMAAAKVPWATIGRIFDVSPQAAMYATGHAKRSPRGAKKTPKRVN